MRTAVASLVLLGLLAVLLQSLPRSAQDIDAGATLKFYCAAGIRRPVQAAARDYESEYGVRVVFDFDGSGTLLARLDAARTGDLYLAGDDSYLEMAREKDLLCEEFAIARMKSAARGSLRSDVPPST